MLSAEQFKAFAKVDYANVNYKGGAAVVGATVAGETDFCIVDLGSASSQLRGGRVRGLAVTSPEPSKLHPTLPTLLQELGVPEFSDISWSVILAPSGTPSTIVGRINTDLVRARRSRRPEAVRGRRD
jgi:tripartite-type tricarboxylate transporter receptor subunit TctC